MAPRAAGPAGRAEPEAVGIRQASPYHHFASAVELAERLAERPEPATVRLSAPARFDIGQLGDARWNIGALYFLPELRGERFARFRSRRDALRTSYERPAAQVVSGVGAGGVPVARTLPFRLVETVIDIRSDSGGVSEETRQAIAEAVLRVLGCRDELARVRTAADGPARELLV